MWFLDNKPGFLGRNFFAPLSPGIAHGRSARLKCEGKLLCYASNRRTPYFNVGRQINAHHPLK